MPTPLRTLARWRREPSDRAIVDLDKSWCRHHGGFIKPPKTEAGDRDIWLPRQAMEAIHFKERMWPDERLLFQPKDDADRCIYGGMYGSYLRKVAKEAGLTPEEIKGTLHFHGMRSHNASMLDALGMSRALIKQNLGHSRVERGDITSVYIHAIDLGNERRRMAQASIDWLMDGIEITPLEEAMGLAKTGYQRLTADERREYHREYRATRKALPAPAADNTRTKAT